MDDMQKRLDEMVQRQQDRMHQNMRDMQNNRLKQQHHNEMLNAQLNLINSNNRVAKEVHGIRDALQTQIDENKLTEEKHDKRSKHEFRLSFAVAIVSAAIALAALFVAIFK